MKAKELAEQYLEDKLKELGTSIPQYKHLVINLMIRYARHMCELQKQECDNNSSIEVIDRDEITNNPIYGVDSDSILKCKNVCDE